MKQDDWHGCYSDGWNGEIVSDAFAHPAKYARGLIKRIYQHIIDEGWAQPGDTILDPFGGVALGGLDAMKHGLHFVGVELEPKFVELGRQNIALWNDLAKRATAWGLGGWGSAILLQGDSRQLASIIGGAAVACSSPPFGEADKRSRYSAQGGYISDCLTRSYTEAKHGLSPANLANLPEGSHALAISSPPYAASLASDDPDRRGGLYRDPKRRGDRTLTAEYGCSPGQLGAMSVSSPPYEGIRQDGGGEYAKKGIGGIRPYTDEPVDYWFTQRDQTNLGNNEGTSFWSAARQIVQELALVLRPGAHAVWVLKAFVRNGEYVNFPEQWMHLCEACGFETLHWHRAWLIEERGAQYTLDGDVEEKRIERKSFFRRLAERNGSPRVDYEVVLCMVRR